MSGWSSAFSRSRLAPCVFVAKASARGDVRDWLDEQGLASCRTSGVFSPTTTGWSVLDAGAVDTFAYGMGGLPSGLRLVGFDVLRLVVDALGLTPPRRLSHEPPPPPVEELRERHASRPDEDDPAAAGRAELLSCCLDGPDLVWAVHALLGDDALLPERQPRHPAGGAWGAQGFTEAAAELLRPHLDVEQALALAGAAGRGERRLGPADAERVLGLWRLGPRLEDFRAAGVHDDLAAVAGRVGAELEQVQSWEHLGAPWHVELALRSRRAPEELAPFLGAGATVPVALTLVQHGVDPDAFAARAAELDYPFGAARELLGFDPVLGPPAP